MKTIQRRPILYKLTKQQKKWRDTNCCPICGLHESKWKRRTDWRCCSVKCTEKFSKVVVFIWQFFKLDAFKRDNYSCVKCEYKPTQETYEGKIIPDTSKLIGDHIKPIAIGGEEYNLKNVQTLCIKCNKIKTKKDMKDIVFYRKQHKSQTKINSQ
ncbi:hypothetical protein LCGC14_0465560 [marine sediment metagenome]|uniref:HNH nuclease domain-containing protein n=1 Tax=marine sediment metagenome TaxID=412755 RepID=A0A0F9SWJ3_9ZZZZ